jgi:hypothetical protein
MCNFLKEALDKLAQNYVQKLNLFPQLSKYRKQ